MAELEARILGLVDGFREIVLLGWDASKLLKLGRILAAIDTFSPEV